MASKGNHPTPLQTGYERVIAHRTDPLFAYTAKQDGVVSEINENKLTLEYKDGSTKEVPLGKEFGVASGKTLPHSLKTRLKVGDKVKTGDLVTYNENYFDVDPFNPKEAIWKSGMLVTTAIMESFDTLEDSSAISERMAEQLSTQMTKVKNIKLNFDQTIRNLVKTGQSVDVESILCEVEDAVTADNDLFDDESLETLRLLANHAPRAKVKGTVERVEVFYNGDKEDMSESIRKLTAMSDRELKRRTKTEDLPGVDGRVDNSMRVDGVPLELDHAVIKVYITTDVSLGVGD